MFLQEPILYFFALLHKKSELQRANRVSRVVPPNTLSVLPLMCRQREHHVAELGLVDSSLTQLRSPN